MTGFSTEGHSSETRAYDGLLVARSLLLPLKDMTHTVPTKTYLDTKSFSIKYLNQNNSFKTTNILLRVTSPDLPKKGVKSEDPCRITMLQIVIESLPRE